VTDPAHIAPFQPCGCLDREDHVDPTLDPDLMLGHGERAERCGDAPPYEVPGTGGWNGLYIESPDGYCLCGHPNYMTCAGYWGHGLMTMTIARTDD
jgi:hypothetical protein